MKIAVVSARGLMPSEETKQPLLNQSLCIFALFLHKLWFETCTNFGFPSNGGA